MAFLLGPPTEHRLAAVMRAAAARSPSYPAVGATRTGEAPPGYRFDRHHVDVAVPSAQRDEAFAAGVRALQSWQVHRGAGAPVFPADAPLAEGTTVVVTLRLSPLLPLVTMAAPCRVVYVTDDPDRFGFGYGTLPGHPEEGEEAFHLLRTPDGLRFAINVFWRPAHLLTRLAASLTRRIQSTITTRYLTTLQSTLTPP